MGETSTDPKHRRSFFLRTMPLILSTEPTGHSRDPLCFSFQVCRKADFLESVAGVYTADTPRASYTTSHPSRDLRDVYVLSLSLLVHRHVHALLVHLSIPSPSTYLPNCPESAYLAACNMNAITLPNDGEE